MDDNASEVREMQLDAIRIDPALQPRVTMDQSTVTEYAEAMEAGDAFPAITVFYDGTCFWLADGWHRVEAARSIRDKRTILAEVREGSRRDALRYSLGANADHGLRRSNEDKRNAVERVLADPEWATWSDREIARVCRVGHGFVGNIRREVTGTNTSLRTYTTKHGTVATMDTSAIGSTNKKWSRPLSDSEQQFINSAVGECVYLIEAFGKHKIGRTATLPSRLASILGIQPEAHLVCAVQTRSSSRAETWFHKRFEPFRTNAEWFDLPKSAIDEFCQWNGDIATIAEASVRTEPAPTESKDGGVYGWTSDYGNDPEHYAPIWRLEQAVNQYLDVRHGNRGEADANTEMRLDTLEALRSAGFDTVYAQIKPHIQQLWRWCDLKQAINNMCEQHRQKLGIERFGNAIDQVGSRDTRTENPWSPALTPVSREETSIREENELVPIPAAPREPSAWAPELGHVVTDNRIVPPNICLTVTIKRSTDARKGKVYIGAETILRGHRTPVESFSLAVATLADLYSNIGAVLMRFLTPDELNLVGETPRGLITPADSVEVLPNDAQPFPIGTRVRVGSRAGEVTAWISDGRVIEFRGDDDQMHRFPSFMVQAIGMEPA